MYRFALEDLKKWKNSSSRKPLIIQGARQVGKTWLMKEFGAQEYENTVYLNFDSDSRFASVFEEDLDPKRIVSSIELLTDQHVNPQKTLIIFDEVQENPKALTSLKYFCEQAPEYNIVCAGSLLGIALHEGTSFPVGKVDFLHLFPLTFREFLLALNEDKLSNLLAEQNWNAITLLRDQYISLLKQYYIIGGMPEVVNSFAQSNDYSTVNSIQTDILKAYEQDFSKHAPARVVPKIRDVWNSIPAQLAKENKKFLYGLVREGARAKEYETAILWLGDCGLLNKINRVTAIKQPLKAYIDPKAFKLFFIDIGLLCCMSGVSHHAILDGNSLFTEFKGALTEQFVCQQFLSKNISQIVYYSNEKNTCEVDFVISLNGEIVPIEVKAEKNLKAKSLKATHDKFNFNRAFRFSMADFKEEEWITNYPLYAVEEVKR